MWAQRPWEYGVAWRFVVGERLPKGDNSRVSLEYESAKVRLCRALVSSKKLRAALSTLVPRPSPLAPLSLSLSLVPLSLPLSLPPLALHLRPSPLPIPSAPPPPPPRQYGDVDRVSGASELPPRLASKAAAA